MTDDPSFLMPVDTCRYQRRVTRAIRSCSAPPQFNNDSRSEREKRFFIGRLACRWWRSTALSNAGTNVRDNRPMSGRGFGRADRRVHEIQTPDCHASERPYQIERPEMRQPCSRRISKVVGGLEIVRTGRRRETR